MKDARTNDFERLELASCLHDLRRDAYDRITNILDTRQRFGGLNSAPGLQKHLERFTR